MKNWMLPKNEVTWHGSGSTSTHRNKRSKASRSVDDRSWRFTIIHLPSGIEVAGEIPLGNYSKKQMQLEKEKLYLLLWSQLELKVARHLRISGW